MNQNEEILRENESRFVLFPIKYDKIWAMRQKALASFWTAEEIDLFSDLDDWNNKLNDNERHYIKHVLAFFAASDGIVNENLVLNFYKDVQIAEARSFYANQIQMEDIHSQTYSLLIDTYVSDDAEKTKLFNAMSNIPSINQKARWAIKWIDDAPTFAHRLVAFAAVEGIFFSSSFCAIYWLKKRGLMAGLTFSNELISRDEGLHTDFACLLHSMLNEKASDNHIQKILMEACEIEKMFVREALPVSLIGMNNEQMCQYVEFVTDRLLLALGQNKIYFVKNPFDWMDIISLQGKTNFFEKRVGDYQKSGIVSKDDNFSLDCEF